MYMYYIAFLSWVSLCGCALNVQEYDALMDFYNATRGPHWTNSTHPWLLGDPCDSQWYGISCDPTNTTVTILVLSSHNLEGTVPSSISKLSNLTMLFLLANPLISGSIPESISTMTSLEHLFITNGRLTGSIPSGIMQLTRLLELSFRYNNLTGTIPPFGALTSLFYLELRSNQLTGTIPSSIGLLTRLAILDIGFNSLSGAIPTTLRGVPLLSFIAENNSNLCDACFRFNRALNTCKMDPTPPNCTCSFTPCGSSACPVNQTCLLYGCPGGSSGLGTCAGDNLLINNTLLNDRNNVSLTEVVSNVNGAVQLDYFSLTNSEVNINGNLIGNSSQLFLQNTIIRIIENLIFKNSTIKVDVYSMVIIERDLNLYGSTLVLNLTGLNSNGEYPLLNYSRVVMLPAVIIYQNPPSCKSISYEFRSHQFSLFVVDDPSCGSMIYVIVGSACGGLLLFALVVAGFIVHRKNVKREEKMNQLKNQLQKTVEK